MGRGGDCGELIRVRFLPLPDTPDLVIYSSIALTNTLLVIIYGFQNIQDRQVIPRLASDMIKETSG